MNSHTNGYDLNGHATPSNVPSGSANSRSAGSETAQTSAFDNYESKLYTEARGTPGIDIKCGPLLRYVGMRDIAPDIWRGSMMIVTSDTTSDYQRVPTAMLRIATSNSSNDTPRSIEIHSTRFHQEQGVSFWRFELEFKLTDTEQRIEYYINADHDRSFGFFVPAFDQTMNIMFYSCNGFSAGVDPSQFKGQLWSDVLRQHRGVHYHVMLGGGDQIYCDMVKENAPIVKQWAHEKNPIKKQRMKFGEEETKQVEEFYLWHYIHWYGFGYWRGLLGNTLQTELPKAMAQIPMINVFDDHDIIDGFGSYSDHTMKIPIFKGIGNVSFKYYLLFQHQTSLDESVLNEPSWILGNSIGPYIAQKSRSVYARLGKSIAFYGLDCRTERKRDQVAQVISYDKMVDRIKQELAASKGEIQHLLLMLGIPIAYPRMVWLENILTSRVMDPVKALSRHGVFKNLLNNFDGAVEILDDLNDHWCAKHHKTERNWLMRQLFDLSKQTGVRITILSGDVHLAGIGRFHSKGVDKTDASRDPNLMLNVISSAIVNAPPPDRLADFLNRRGKIHHFSNEIDEDMVKIFTHDVNGSKRNNHTLLPRRNWCSIIRQGDVNHGDGEARAPGPVNMDTENDRASIVTESNHHESQYLNVPDSLSVTLHMEKDPHSEMAITVPYEIIVPKLYN